MVMEQARIAVFEDNKDHQEMVIDSLMRAGHLVVALATTIPQAHDVIDDIADNLLECDAIVIDGNLCYSRHCGTDAQTLYAHMEERGLDCLFIGNSAGELNIPLDANVPKMKTYNLGSTVTRLMASSKPHVLQAGYASHQGQNVLAAG